MGTYFIDPLDLQTEPLQSLGLVKKQDVSILSLMEYFGDFSMRIPVSLFNFITFLPD